MKIALLQYNVVWHNALANQEKVSLLLNQCSDADLVVLPEMFASGFTMKPADVAESMQGSSVSFLKEEAQKRKQLIGGSLVIKENDNYFNRFVWTFPSGEVQYYDKKHRFTMAQEHEHYSAGDRQLVFSYKGISIKPLVCYDLRFPVWCRTQKPIELMVFCASWPAARISAWDALLKARAIENQCYVAAVNRVGEDALGIDYNGHSQVIDPYGNVLAFSEKEEVLFADLDLEELNRFREKFPVANDADGFKLI